MTSDPSNAGKAADIVARLGGTRGTPIQDIQEFA